MIPKEILRRYRDGYIQSNFTPEYLKGQAEILRAESLHSKPEDDPDSKRVLRMDA
jgi:hypothetical protein